MESIDLIQDLGVVLLLAAAAAWICQRLGLPAVIGYLAAGVLVSPNTHSLGVLGNIERIHAIAQVGLVFLLFRLGQGLPLQRLKRISRPFLLGTVLMALFVLTGCRWLGEILGWPGEYSLVLAAILMISSTEVLRKSLGETKETNREHGQTALTMTALDDVLAVLMLTLLTFVAQTRGSDAMALFGQFMRVNALVVFVAVGCLLLVPAVARRMHQQVSAEVLQLAVAGLLFALALVSARAGFSAALGAFFLGSIISSTAGRGLGERLEPLAGIFGPVFFVAMGILFDWRVVLEAWPLVAGVVLLGIGLRFGAVTAALLMIGRPPRESIRAGAALVPVGEFSLILALAGVMGGLVPESFYAAAVSLCLVTALGSTAMLRVSQKLSHWWEERQPKPLGQLLELYHDWTETLRQRQNASLVWRLAAPRLTHIAILVLFVSGVLVFAQPAYAGAGKWLGNDGLVGSVLPWLTGLLFFILVIAPLVALWRQVEAFAMICGEAVIKRRPDQSRLRPLFVVLLRTCILCAITAWFVALVPYGSFPVWALPAVGMAVVVVAAFFWRGLIHLQSRFEIELRTHLAGSAFAPDSPALPEQRNGNGHAELELAEVRMEGHGQGATCAIAELPLRAKFGCTVVRIDRQGIIIQNPGPEAVLYPNDRVLILGAQENLKAAEEWLNRPRAARGTEVPSLSELSLGQLKVPKGFRQVGAPLRELGIRSQFGIQIVRIKRWDRAILSPGPHESLSPGDHLLVLGTPDQVSEMAAWLAN